MKCLGLEHTVDRLGEPIQKPVKRVTFTSNGYFRDAKGASWFSALEGADCPMMIFETGKGHTELAFVIELQCKFFSKWL